jgi:hypothetical protein
MLWEALFERVIHVSGGSASDDHALRATLSTQKILHANKSSLPPVNASARCRRSYYGYNMGEISAA